MWVKICGITRLEDARCAIDAGADALGFVFYPPSPRYIDPLDAKAICSALPLHVNKIGLFVDQSPEMIDAICFKSGMDSAQLHFDVDEAFLDALKTPYFQVVRAQKEADVHRYANTVRFVDAYVQEHGGMGKRIDLSWFKEADRHNIILAGGLDPENVQEVKALGFYGVDVSSGVEHSRGVKDPFKIKTFIKRAKA